MADKRGSRSRSLMQRLAQVVNGEVRQDLSEREAGQPQRRHWHPAIHFGLGLTAGGAIGAVALLGLLELAPDQAAGSDHLSTQALAALTPWPVAPPASHSVAARASHPADTFDMVIDRGERASAPFGLRLTGAGEAGVEVLLRDVPATALLSRGVRRGEGTWAVSPSDLAALHVSLSEGTPDTFDVTIDVVAPADVATASTVARVRLVDGTMDARQAAAAPAAPAALVRANATAVGAVDQPPQPPRTIASGRPAAAAGEDRARTPAPQRAAAATAVPQAAPQPRHWPEGASGLGAVSRESDRQVWWKMPAPTWSPFQTSGQ